MGQPTRHLVGRCFTCRKPIWAKTMAGLLGHVPHTKGVGEIAFTAITKAPGQGRAWKYERALMTLPDVAAMAGQAGIDRLHALARRAFERMWSVGLLSWADVQEVVSRVPQTTAAPVPALRDLRAGRDAEPVPHHDDAGADPHARSARAVACPAATAPAAPADRAAGGSRSNCPPPRHEVPTMNKRNTKPAAGTSTNLAVVKPPTVVTPEPPMTRLARTLHDTPLGNMFTEDLAAAREHGAETVRVGRAADGNPVIYARDEAIGRAIGELIQNRTAVHVLTIPPLTVQEYDVLARGAAARLMPPAPEPVAIPAVRRRCAFRVEVRAEDGEGIATSEGVPNVTTAVRWAREWNAEHENRGFPARVLVLREDVIVREYERRRSALKRLA